ncbi:hypothetical protein GW17_00006190 [Ensete ventricosum]|nr:hypothetical protein GW17_00006190 [Ensete ventricosum]
MTKDTKGEKSFISTKPLQNCMNQQKLHGGCPLPEVKKNMERRRGRRKGKTDVDPATEIETGLSVSPPVSTKGIFFCRRPGFGQVGSRCIVKANHFLAELTNKDLIQYDVSIRLSNHMNRAIMSELVRLYREIELGMKLPAYDGRKGLYTAGYLPFNSKEFVVKLVERDGSIGIARSVAIVLISLSSCFLFLTLTNYMVRMFQKFNCGPVIPAYSAKPEQMEKAIKHVYSAALNKLKGKELELLIAILPDNNGSLYCDLKRICETDLGLISQCCLTKHVFKTSKQYLANVSLKINVKVVDSQDWPEVTKYAGLVCAQAHRQELIQDLFKTWNDPQQGTVTGGMIRFSLPSFQDDLFHIWSMVSWGCPLMASCRLYA